MLEFDKRAYKRAICICEAELITENEDSIEISVIDLAAGGMKFFTNDCKNEAVYDALSPGSPPSETPEPCLKLGNVYKLKLSIHEPGIDIVEILVDIKIRRADTRIGAENIRHYGASFENLTTALSIRLDEILQYKKRHKNTEL
ncbi:MAG: PilZ domain-containing protein [Oscillospiraceae bacterium]|nr:PilZ domain-containing protein [Oscillospiraceae bacterium]